MTVATEDEVVLRESHRTRVNANLILHLFLDAWLSASERQRRSMGYGVGLKGDIPRYILDPSGKTIGQCRFAHGSWQLDWLRSTNDLRRLDEIVEQTLKEDS